MIFSRSMMTFGFLVFLSAAANAGDAVFPAQPIRVAAEACSVPKAEGTMTCQCGSPKGTVTKKIQGTSCYTATGKKCSGPYYTPCTVVCDPRGSVPAPSATCK